MMASASEMAPSALAPEHVNESAILFGRVAFLSRPVGQKPEAS
jgi:hypothetical protein